MECVYDCSRHREFERGCQECEYASTLNLIHDSDQRAIKMWRAAHPDKAHMWPDRAQMILWLLENKNVPWKK